ncbi:MAG: hypothetical protein ACOX7H_06710 [Bacillota bacterium]
MRSLGYNDTEGDFSWNNPNNLAKQVGILADDVDLKNFLRADLVLVSYDALDAKIKDGTQTLREKLSIPLLSDYVGSYEIVEETANGIKYTNTGEKLYLHINGSLAICADTEKNSDYEWIYGNWSIKNGSIIFDAKTFGSGTGQLQDGLLTVKTEDWEGLYQKIDSKQTLADYVGAYKIHKENIKGKESSNNEDMLFLHEDGTIVYTLIKDYGYDWIPGTWNIKDDGDICIVDFWGPTTFTINDDNITWNYSWKGYYPQIAAKDELKDYVGAYKLEKEIDNGVEQEVAGEIMYLHGDGTIAYTIKDGSDFKWIYGTWSVKDGIIKCDDNVFGPSEGKFEGDTFALKGTAWQGYYTKINPDPAFAAFMGTYKMDKQINDGIESEGTGEILYLHADGTMIYVTDDDYSTCKLIIKDDIINIFDDLYGLSKLMKIL